MISFLWATLAFAAPADTPVTLAAATGPAMGPPSVGWSGSVHGIAHIKSFGVEGVIKEGLWTADTRAVGALSLSARWRATSWMAIRAGIVHHHETPAEVLQEQPMAAAFGSAPGIVHRTGAEAALSFDVPLKWGAQDRWGVLVETGVSGFPEGGGHAHHEDPRGPAVYAWVEAGLTFDVGRKRIATPVPVESVAAVW